MKICTCRPELLRPENEAERYRQQVVIELPLWSTERARRLHEGMSTSVCIDPCIVEEIIHLWSHGIDTTNCCCGHNVFPASVYVVSDSVDKMLSLGYKPMPHGMFPNTESGFILFELLDQEAGQEEIKPASIPDKRPGVEYYECPECGKETLFEESHSQSPSCYTCNYRCENPNCEHSYSVSA